MKSTVQYKKIKKGNIVKFIQKINLRDDISCGIGECSLCEANRVKDNISIQNNILILDTEIIINQIDAIKNFSEIENVVLFQSEYLALSEKDQSIYQTFQQIIESRSIYIFPNEFHSDCQISNENELNKVAKRKEYFVKAVEFYLKHLNEGNNQKLDKNITILTIDENKSFYTSRIKNSKKLNFNIFTLNEYAVKQIKSPDLLNYLTIFEEVKNDVNNLSKNEIYEAYPTAEEMQAGMKTGKYFRGKLNFANDNLETGIVKAYIFDKDILINSKKNLNRAMHGDIVCVEILDEKEWLSKQVVLENDENLAYEYDDEKNNFQDEAKEGVNLNLLQKIKNTKKAPVGKIIGILRQTRNNFCGTIYNPTKPNQSSIPNEYKSITNYNIFIPIDSKYPLFLLKLHEANVYYNQRIQIHRDAWDVRNPLPSAHFIKNVGPCNDVVTENEVILLEHDVITNPFSNKILAQMPVPNNDSNVNVTEEDLKVRTDLRHITVCSIDPPGCKDIDDALHCRVLENGNYEIGCHIADVSHYIKHGSEVDKIAARSCNTIYLVHRRTDMLPKVLTENLCSLVSDKDRFAFSVLWEVDKDSLNILEDKTRYVKSIIRSRRAFTYGQAQELKDDLTQNNDLALSIRGLYRIAKKLKQDRMNNGALVLASNEMKFNVNAETNTINDISIYQTYETNSLVEEFMLLGNVYVAKKIYNYNPSCAVLRRHPPPKLKEVSALGNLLEKYGYTGLDSTTSKSLGESLDKLKKSGDEFFNRLVRIMLTRTMNQAKYFSSSEFDYTDYCHYGLAMEIYTHFTSPIRRYSDVLVHRLLSAAIEYEALPFDMTNKVKLTRECDQMNKQNRVAFFCSRESNDFSTFLFFESKTEILDVVIFGLDNYSVKAISQKYGIEANILFDEKNAIKETDNENKTVVLKDGQKLKVFDRVQVEVKASYFNYRRAISYHFLKKLS